MKIARVMSIVLFVLALSAFIFYTFYSRQTSDFSAPVISAESDTITAPVNVTDEELLAGMKAIDNLNGIPVRSVFGKADLPDYAFYDYHECPMCKAKQKIDGLANAFGISML